MPGMDVLKLEDLAKVAALALKDAVERRRELPEDELRTMLRNGFHGLWAGQALPSESLDDIFTTALAASSVDYNHHHLARWFEIHPDDFAESPLEALRPDVLFRHIYYERMLAEWFDEWGYAVEIGEVLPGIEGTEFVPDLHAELETLHGSFDVAVCLFCALPASTTGVLAKLENIEAYAVEGSPFAESDLFVLATPHQFSEQATNQMRVQTQQERYSVVPLEGSHLESLERAPDAAERKARLTESIDDWLARVSVRMRG